MLIRISTLSSIEEGQMYKRPNTQNIIHLREVSYYAPKAFILSTVLNCTLLSEIYFTSRGYVRTCIHRRALGRIQIFLIFRAREAAGGGSRCLTGENKGDG